VKDTREGKWIFYTIDEKNFSAHAKLLAEFFSTVQANLEKGVQASPIRTQPCLCEELQTKAGIRKRDDALVNSWLSGKGPGTGTDSGETLAGAGYLEFVIGSCKITHMGN
jgi:hypothetical protein